MTGQDLADLAIGILPLGWGYIYGQSGAMWTAAKQAQLERTTAKKYESGRKYGAKWIGHNVTDCSGLVVNLCKRLGFAVPHGSNSLWDRSLYVKGPIVGAFVPIGALVFKRKGIDDYYHVGIYVGSGRVVEARGTQAGVVSSDLVDWGYYGLLKCLKYDDSGEEVKALEVGPAFVDVPNDGTVNIRSKPDSSGKKQGTLREGEACEVLSVDGDWAEVEYKKTGYIMSKFLRNIDSKQE